MLKDTQRQKKKVSFKIFKESLLLSLIAKCIQPANCNEYKLQIKEHKLRINYYIYKLALMDYMSWSARTLFKGNPICLFFKELKRKSEYKYIGIWKDSSHRVKIYEVNKDKNSQRMTSEFVILPLAYL